MIREGDNEIFRRVLEYKAHLNENPEAGWLEVATTQYIKEQLRAQSLIEGLGEQRTGAIFDVGAGPLSIFVRADIDALNTSEGPRHVCGHSTHTAALMGAYLFLKDRERQLTNQGKKVIFIFQPAEEVHPSGARTLLSTYPELLVGSRYGFAIHVEPNMPVGSIGIQEGPTWAAHDSIKVEIRGKAVHVKNTPQGVDALAGAAEVIRLFRQLQTTFPDFGRSIVFNFNTLHGGVANNSVADKAILTGAVRWLAHEDQQRVKVFFEELPRLVNEVFPGEIDITYVDQAVPVCENDTGLAREVSTYMAANSSFNIKTGGQVDLGVEDFAHFAREYPTLFTRVGIDSPFDLHDTRMVVSDEATVKAYEYWQHVMEWWIDKPEVETVRE